MRDPAQMIERSLEWMAERDLDPSPQVYARLFAELPQTEERFARDTSGSIRAEMLSMVFNCLTDPGGPYQINLIKAERVNHDGFGTPNAEFNQFFRIVHETCREIVGADWTPEIEAAWSGRIQDLLARTQ